MPTLSLLSHHAQVSCPYRYIGHYDGDMMITSVMVVHGPLLDVDHELESTCL